MATAASVTEEAIAAGVDASDTAAAVATTGVVLTAGERTSITNAILDLANTLDGKTLRQVLRYIAASSAGKISGAGTGTEKVYGVDGTTERIRATVDSSGNRTAISLDP